MDNPLPRTAIADIAPVVSRLHASFRAGKSRSLAWRLAQLDAAERLLRECETQICDAIHADLHASSFDAYVLEVFALQREVGEIRRHLPRWMRPKRASTDWILLPGKARVLREPRGVVAIIGPWNYPFMLLMQPLLGALAAGNCAVVKPSEVTTNVSKLIADLIPRYFDPDCVAVVEGGIEETQALLEQPLDHVFFTGSPQGGRAVMAAAAKQATPVTLELGGKSPCVVDRSADLAKAAKRISWGKFIKCGQTCIAPDYVLVDESVHDRFVEELIAGTKALWGDDSHRSDNYGRIVNLRHHRRLMDLMQYGEPLYGGDGDESDLYIAPTFLTNVAMDSPLMQEEIFGPILPILPYRDLDEVIALINSKPRPLELFIFSTTKATQKRLIDSTLTGGVSINNLHLRWTVHDLPFGGVGESGFGNYQGAASLETFSYERSVFAKPASLETPFFLLYPPFSDFKRKLVRLLSKT